MSDRRAGADVQKRIYDDDGMKVTQDSLGEIFCEPVIHLLRRCQPLFYLT